MRPSLSFTEESGSPTIVNLGKPDAVSASTRTRWASTPTTAAVRDVASMQGSNQGRGWESPARDCAHSRARRRRDRSGPGPRLARVDGERVAGRDARALQVVPGLEGADRGLEGPGDGGQGVAGPHLVADTDLAAVRLERRGRLGGGGHGRGRLRRP